MTEIESKDSNNHATMNGSGVGDNNGQQQWSTAMINGNGQQQWLMVMVDSNSCW